MTPLTSLGAVFVLIAVAMILLLPRRWASVPLLVGTLYMTLSQGIQLGPFHLFCIRLLIAAGMMRVILRGERPPNGLNSLDWLMLVSSVWALASSFFHIDPASTLIGNFGFIFNTCGIYFLLRTYCQSFDDIVRLCRIATLLLVPVAFEMLQEQLTGYNMFSVLGGVADSPQIRVGRLRAQGPFAHAILAGTVGAVSLPFAIVLWRQYRKTAIVGIMACATMILASASSGPFMSGVFAIGGLLMWPFRHRMRLFRWLAFLSYVALDLLMDAPAYFLIARIDVAGGSTGWHRAALIESAIEHLGEWWLGGTDYTRHWMPTGVSWSPDHTDITNHYLQMGVVGGLPLMLLFIAILSMGFSYVGRVVRPQSTVSEEKQFVIWALGVSLFAHAATSISVSYFDQSFIFLYLTLAAIATMTSITVLHEARERARPIASKRPERPTAQRTEQKPETSRCGVP
jgi:hypothetical protein